MFSDRSLTLAGPKYFECICKIMTRLTRNVSLWFFVDYSIITNGDSG